MLDLFTSSRDVFVLKDIEKMAVKRGIIQQSVKDVLQVLTVWQQGGCSAPQSVAQSCAAQQGQKGAAQHSRVGRVLLGTAGCCSAMLSTAGLPSTA